ncbi:ATP-binding cassette domain-containing protein, partial [Enterococcus faecalis]|uniref:ATP-binding cassette domain-containing protein n=1 Tax=Enterococcus faecalis TaxID=1351 RepID=UPI003D6A21AD
IFKVIEQGKNMNTKIKLNERVQKITIENLTFRYNKVTIIEKLSAKFINGVPYYIIGSNGSGKSTLGRLIAGLLQPNDGKIEWNSTSLSTIDKGNRISKIGYLQSNPFLFEG